MPLLYSILPICLRCMTVILVVLNVGVPVYMDYGITPPLCLIIETFTYQKEEEESPYPQFILLGIVSLYVSIYFHFLFVGLYHHSKMLMIQSYLLKKRKFNITYQV